MDIPRKVFFIKERSFGPLAGLVDADSKNVKILKYRNETKILHGLADLLDEIRNTSFLKNRAIWFFTWRSSGIIVLLVFI
jgi:hypothetical protein